MKAVVLNGMEAGDTLTASVQHILLETLQKRAWHVQPFMLHDIDVRPCEGCFSCWLQTPGRCVMHDTDEIAAALAQSDLAIYLTPVTFGGYSSQLKKVLDHLILLVLPFFKTVDGETHHVPRYRKHPDLLVLGVMPDENTESEAIFTSLAERNAVNMSAPHWAAGIIVEEHGPDSIRQTVRDLLTDVGVM